MSLITLFSAPKPFTDAHISTIQKNAIASWKQLGNEIEIVLLGNDPGIGEACKEMGVHHIAEVKCNDRGTPVISSMFNLTREKYPSSIYIVINTDIIVFPELIDSIKKVAEQSERFLIVGQRWDLSCETLLEFDSDWETDLKKQVERNGKLHPRGGSDYFIFPDACYRKIPDFAIGRAGWDNWMIYEARRNGWRVVDGTVDVQIIHQNHDYKHLPDGKPHYKLPETFKNVRLAGGERTIFTLADCDYKIAGGRLQKTGWGWTKFWREVEIFPLIRLKSYLLGQLFFTAFHPIRAYREFRTWLRQKTGN